jgi:cell division protein FtsL
MAQAARRIDSQAPRRTAARIAAVPPARSKASNPSRAPKPVSARKPARARAQEARCRTLFTTVAAVAIALTVVGLLRVAIVARAAEMTLSETDLAASIKAQRIETDRLEIDRGSLATPSRIEEIASQSMGMGRPASVRYITMPTGDSLQASNSEGDSQAQARTTGQQADAGAALQSVLTALADMSAVEAQALLVGDVGVTGSR